MKHLIIGTAGHIDHGKTTLIQALTGRNTDRFEEEKRRGITIDLGFTYFDLPDGDRVGIIDVPGHEKFIPNMVAGVAGMDLVLLVVAADEGMMPQTREHIDILGLLGIEKSIVVLNKCDLVEEDWIDLVEEELKEELKETFLCSAPIVRVSATTGEGLSDLTDLIVQMTKDEVKEREIYTIPRLPIDRVFNLSGFGTVITGTLLSGSIKREDALELYPIRKGCKIRSIQVHGEEVEACFAGQRVAINISNVKKSELKRGDVLTKPNSMKNTDLLDVRLQMLQSSNWVLKNQARLHFFTGTSEVLARAVLLDKEELKPGESGFVQLRLENQMALRRGDAFVVRFYSPMETIGGGIVLEPNPTKKKRFQEKVIEELQRKEAGSSADVLELLILEHAQTMILVSELSKITAMSLEEVQEDITALIDRGDVLSFPMKKDTYVWHVQSEGLARQTILEAVRSYQEQHPYQPGMNKASLHMTCLKKLKINLFDSYINYLVAENYLKREEEFISFPDYQIQKDSTYRKDEGTIINSIQKAGFDFVKFSEIQGLSSAAMDVLMNVCREGKLVRIADDIYTSKDNIEAAKTKILEKLQEENLITIAQVRDMFATSRKSAKPLLEYMDTVKITKKTGAESERVAYKA